MTAQAKKPANQKVGAEVAQSGAKAPFPFRTAISIFLLAGNFLIAGIYFHLVNP
ncbi:photosystem one PsaX [Hassallia byssoidea VB512170]|uniref:Photosystem one PsaX n=1 Tax=Hassallia byssoidea VB512170 TaxID=1304833 RepID=A0A846H800_9CYAN|nr:photosystem I protein PsaX [Hassalia byssoidea]NEU73476.1 photosystem one PsaX [Hassalia byssoidea VB512170]